MIRRVFWLSLCLTLVLTHLVPIDGVNGLR
jgi:hypothetical protein